MRGKYRHRPFPGPTLLIAPNGWESFGRDSHPEFGVIEKKGENTDGQQHYTQAQIRRKHVRG
jgi:hypothetical protein